MVIAAEKGAAGGDPALLLERSRAITLQGFDRKGRAVVRVVGSYFPGTVTPSREPDPPPSLPQITKAFLPAHRRRH